MREVDPTPRTSHVTPPFWELSTLAAAIGRWGLARFSALHNAPGCVCDARPGCGTKPCLSPRLIPGTQQHAQAVLFFHHGSHSHEVVGSGRGHARLLPKWGTRPAFQHPPSLLEWGLQWSSGLPPFGYRVCATMGEMYVSPVAPPLEPSLCSQLPTPLWWRSRSPALPHRLLRPPLPWHALYVLYYVYASACPVCGMGAWGVCVVSGCECSLRVGSVGLPRLVVGCASGARVGLSA